MAPSFTPSIHSCTKRNTKRSDFAENDPFQGERRHQHLPNPIRETWDEAFIERLSILGPIPYVSPSFHLRGRWLEKLYVTIFPDLCAMSRRSDNIINTSFIMRRVSKMITAGSRLNYMTPGGHLECFAKYLAPVQIT